MTAGVAVPAVLRATMTAAHGPAGAAWCDRLPALVAGFARRWGVPVGEPFDAPWHWVGTAGEDAVLKVGYPSAERDVARETAVLRTWGGVGAVRVLAADTGGDDAEAVLLERVRPGTDLLHLPDREAFPLLGAVGRALHASGADRPGPAREPGDLAGLRAGHPLLPRETTGRAAGLVEHLIATSAEPVLCHGDLHHGNVLVGGGGPVAIDPRGVWGEPALDVGVALLNPLGTLPEDREQLRALLEQRLELICPAMGVDVDRGRSWTAVSAAVSAVWSAQDGGGVDRAGLAVFDVLS
jgi:streptomycin 6-kinase